MRNAGRKTASILGAIALLALTGAGAASAQEAQETPAPPGKSEAVAAEVEGVVAAGHTRAEADQDGGEAEANALELGGETPSEQFGGTQEGDGEQSGALLDTGDTPLGRLQVTPWSARVGSQGATTTSHGLAAVLRLVLGDGLVSLSVLQSESEATHSGRTSTGSSSSDGAVLNAGGEDGLTVTVLHAEARSDGRGESYLLGIQDQKLFTNEQADGQCQIEIPSVIGLVCLSASGGAGEVRASVADVTVGGGSLVGQVVGAEGSGTQTAPEVLGEQFTPDEPRPAPSGDGALPRTGGAFALTGLAGLALAGAGVALRRVVAGRTGSRA